MLRAGPEHDPGLHPGPAGPGAPVPGQRRARVARRSGLPRQGPHLRPGRARLQGGPDPLRRGRRRRQGHRQARGGLPREPRSHPGPRAAAAAADRAPPHRRGLRPAARPGPAQHPADGGRLPLPAGSAGRGHRPRQGQGIRRRRGRAPVQRRRPAALPRRPARPARPRARLRALAPAAGRPPRHRQPRAPGPGAARERGRRRHRHAPGAAGADVPEHPPTASSRPGAPTRTPSRPPPTTPWCAASSRACCAWSATTSRSPPCTCARLGTATTPTSRPPCWSRRPSCCSTPARARTSTWRGKAILEALHEDPGNPYAVRHLERLLSEPESPFVIKDAVSARAVRAQSDAERAIFYVESAELLERVGAWGQARRAYLAAKGALPNLAPADLGLHRTSSDKRRSATAVRAPTSIHVLVAEARDAVVRAGPRRPGLPRARPQDRRRDPPAYPRQPRRHRAGPHPGRPGR